MATDLKPSEREDRETERLINRRPAPSRKHRDRRAPRHDQRRRRIREDDPDLKKGRKDRGAAAKGDAYDRELDGYLSDLESALGRIDDETGESSERDLDAAIRALSDVADVPPERAKRVVEKAEKDDSSLRDLLMKSDLDPSRVDDLDRALGLSASYEMSWPMSSRTGAYHGVRDVRGNPTDSPNTVPLPDRRYFTEKDYDLIVKSASDLLKQDWFKYEWDGGSDDAPIRAALDIAIQTANGNVYQSKIDSETYELLLNRLAKWGYDTFSETVLPMKKPAGNRSASAMKNTESYKQIVRVASDLRETNPVASLSLLKNLRALVSTEAEPAGQISDALSDGAPRAGVAAQAPAAEVVSVVSSAVESGDSAEVPFDVLLKVAASSAAAKQALGPFILAASKKKKGGKKGKVPPQFLKNMKGKKGEKDEKGEPKGKSKKASISAEDTSW